MALVHVEDVGCRPALDGGERPHGAHAADPGQQLLLHPVFLVTAVKPIGDVTQVVLVLRDVGVQQQQRDPPDLGHPYPGAQLPGLRQRQLHQDRRAGGIGEQAQRQALRVQRWVVLPLPAIGRQGLPEVPRAVVQADGDQRQTEVRRRLQMVAGQDAQATGVVRQHLGDTELHREVRDAGRHGRRILLLVPHRAGEVVVEIAGQLVQPRQKAAVHGEFVQTLGCDRAQQGDRVLPGLRPQLRIDRREQILRRRIPGPAQVGRQPAQRREPLGQVGTDREPTQGLHVTQPY